MLNKRSHEKELIDDLSLNSDELRKNLNELACINRWFGSKTLLLGALDEIYKKNSFGIRNFCMYPMF